LGLVTAVRLGAGHSLAGLVADTVTGPFGGGAGGTGSVRFGGGAGGAGSVRWACGGRMLTGAGRPPVARPAA
jgi:hypothetical protein